MKFLIKFYYSKKYINKMDRPFSSSQVDGSSQLEDPSTKPNSNCFVPKQRYPRGGSSYSDIHDQEVLDSLSDRP